MIVRFYQDFKQRHGQRPRAGEAAHEGYNPRSVRRYYGSWFRFVKRMEGLTEDEDAVLDQAGEFLDVLEKTPMTKSYKMLLVLAMLKHDSFPGAVEIDVLAAAFARLAARSERLRDDVAVDLEDLQHVRSLLKKNPIAAWTGGKGSAGKAFFAFEDGVLATQLPVAPDLREPLQEMVRELVEWRLAEYLNRSLAADLSGPDRFLVKVNHSSGKPILHPLPREGVSGIPAGWTPVIADGQRYEANFVKIAVNVMRPQGKTDNVLAKVIRGWFGEDAGLPGTQFFVAFERRDDAWEMLPAGASDDAVGEGL